MAWRPKSKCQYNRKECKEQKYDRLDKESKDFKSKPTIEDIEQDDEGYVISKYEELEKEILELKRKIEYLNSDNFLQHVRIEKLESFVYHNIRV